MKLEKEIKNQIKELDNIKAEDSPVEIELNVDKTLDNVGEGKPIKFEIGLNKLVVTYKGSSIAYKSKKGFSQEKLDINIDDAINYFKQTKK